MKTKEKNAGLYKVTDVAVNAEDENIVNFSWLISQNATKLVGTLNFLIRFICVDDEENVEYAWHTAICTEPVVLEGMCNTENIVEQYADILGQWREELLSTKSTGSWNDLTDKPFYDNTVKSSYSFETLPSVSFEASDYTWYKISDLTPSAEELLTTEISHDFGEGVTVRRPQESEFLVQDESCSAFQFSTTPTFGFFIAYITGAIETELGTANVPETGIYFGYATGETPPADLIIEVAYHDIKPLDEKYLPEDAIITIIDA